MSGVNVASDNSGALSLLFGPQLAPQINLNSVLLHALERRPGEGKAINFTAQFSGAANADSGPDGARKAYSDADNEIEVPATLPWALYSKVASVSGLAKATARTTRWNPGSLTGPFGGSLLGARAGQSAVRLGRGIAGHLYSGTATGGASSSAQVIGLASSVKSSSTYAGIDPGTYTEWVSTQNAISGSLTFAKIRSQLLTPIYNACGELPSFMVTDPTTFDIVRNLYGSTNAPFLREIVLAGDGGDRVVKLGAGMQALDFEGVPLLRDRDCTSGVIYGINTRYLWIEQLPEIDEDFLNPDVMQEALRAFMGNNSFRLPEEAAGELAGRLMNAPGIVPFFQRLGKTGDSDELLLTAKVQMVNQRRNAHGKLTGITG